MASEGDNRVVPVVIIGGGPVGLTCSILLSLRGISNMLFERHPSTSIHPKACGINQRTTEILRVMGVEEDVYAISAPAEIAGRTAWYTSFGEEGKEVFSRDAWGGGQYAEEYAQHSPSKYCILPQIKLEPILKQRAMELNPHRIFYGHEVLMTEDHGDFAEVTVKNGSTGDDSRCRGTYVIVADGGRQFTTQLGVEWCGEGDLLTMISAHIRSPIRALHPDSRNFITWFTNPAMGGSTLTGYLYQLGPWPEAMTNPEIEEWMFVCAQAADDPTKFDAETALARARKTIGIPDLNMELISLSEWTVNALYASQWRVGRHFLVGDSAHRIPPWGALGMNSGIQDANNLVWKLSMALKDSSRHYDSLLDTYYEERSEVGKRVGQTSLNNMRSHSGQVDRVMGVNASQSQAENLAAGAAFFDKGHPKYAEKQRLIQLASQALDTEFKAPGTVALRDLLDLELLTLFVDNKLEEKIDDNRVKVVVVGQDGWRDKTGQWEKYRGVDRSGDIAMDATIEWFGATTFRVKANGLVIFLDTWLERPDVLPKVLDISDVAEADYIFISHAHFDHLPGADKIAIKTGAHVIANGEAINVLRLAGVPEDQLIPVSGGERVPLFTLECRQAAARSEVDIAPGPPGAPAAPDAKLAAASVHVWPSLHCLMPGGSHADVPAIMDTGKEYIGGASQYVCTLDITFGMKYGLLKIGDHMPRDAMDSGMRSFVDYVNGPARECMSHFDGGQLMYNFLFGEEKTLLWNGHLGGYDGILKTVQPQPDVLIQAIAGRANLNGRPFDGSAAQFAVQVSKLLGEPKKVIWCLHDEAPIKPWTVDVSPATQAVETETSSEVTTLQMGTPDVLF
ncbi:2, 4-dichlorophenol 6-monooxygenase [Colletotrichum sp. SAR 10_98]|nr:2, 4-dichlorophenol 6-monooxygenase [Colletotrichum sp. SAR 10_98]